MPERLIERRFRFGLTAEPAYTAARWRATARRAEELGYSTLLSPDGLHRFAPFPAMAVAATVTSTLRVGTYVLASTVRPARTTAWEAHSVARLSENRLELGIGAGNGWMNQVAVEEIGMPPTTPAQRLALVRDTVEQLRKLEADDPEGGTRTPVLIAAGGPRSRALAGQLADIVALPHGRFATREEMRLAAAEAAAAAGDRADRIEYNIDIAVIGETIPPWMEPLTGTDLGALIAADSLLVLRGTPREMADELQRRRDLLGCSYLTVSALHAEAFAPVVELLRDR